MQIKDGAFSLVSAIDPHEWTVFQRYAKRIKVLFYTPSRIIHPSVFLHLHELSQGVPLLPALRHLTWQRARSPDPAATLFSSPSLRVVDISLHQPDWGLFEDVHIGEDGEVHAVRILLHNIAAEAPSLESLKFSGVLPSQLASFIIQFRHLRHLDFSMAGAVDVETLRALSAIDALVYLNIYMGGVAENTMLSEAAFQSLESLTVSGSFDSIGFVLGSIQSTVLHDISIVANIPHAPEESLFYSVLLQNKFSRSLRRLHMRLPVTTCRNESADAITIISPLLHVKGMENLHLEFDGRMLLRDKDIDSMASSWPYLQHFYLMHRSVDCDPSLRSLVSFATHCLNLKELAFVVDARPPLSATPTLTTPHPLRSLRLLGNVRLDKDSASIAPFIRSLFPSLQHFEAYAWDPQANATWVNIQYAIPSLKRKKTGRKTRKLVALP
ncbi:predicted protein [Sparassis crispa]|uniref:F-box domain-containing protein n=1 Tax=Sparassis crispa TaxID=139825 RepID=A0A401G6T5_9APHY|nr:predicted protein [Sparassis crispa]GBE77880.1 predicted protein [Sparassis crispa]